MVSSWCRFWLNHINPRKNLPKFRMPLLYSFGYEFRLGLYRVNFYDSANDIIAAESLAQVNHQSRRKWAQNLFDIFEQDSNVLQLEVRTDESDTNLFSKRLVTENWTPYVAVFEILQSQNTLQIFRFYLFIIILRRI